MRETNPPKTNDIGWKDLKNKETPSKLKHKLNVAGDWSFLLTLIIMIGTAGTYEIGESWSEVMRGFAMSAGAGFLTWALKKMASFVK